MQINIKKLHKNAVLPNIAHIGDAGADLCSIEHIFISPRQWHIVKTGLSIELPLGYEAQIRPRSGLAAKHGITVLNTPGTIDSGYRGEIGVIIMNHSNDEFEIVVGMKIAQMVIAQYEIVEYVEATELSDTERGDGGFGSTGE
jgi:dUTP diphosphatase